MTWIDYRNLLLEVMLAIICPLPDVELIFYIGSRAYDLDKILSALALLKCFFVLRLIPHFTDLRGNLGRVIFDLAGVDISFGVHVKIQLKARPVTSLGFLFIVTAVLLGFSVQLFE